MSIDLRKIPNPIHHGQHTILSFNISMSWQKMTMISAYNLLNRSAKPSKIEIKFKTWTRDLILSCPWQKMHLQSPLQGKADPSPLPEKQLRGYLLTGLPPQGPFVHLPFSISTAFRAQVGWRKESN